MKHLCSIIVLAAMLLAPAAHADDTNLYPKANLEIFEEQTGLILVRGTEDIGTVTGKNGSVTVKLRETRQAESSVRVFGVFIIVSLGDGVEDATCVDDDELDALTRSMDYLGKVDWSVSSLGYFEAGYTTRSGLRAASYSSRRSGTIEAMMVSSRLHRCRANLTIGQFIQVRTMLEQCRAKIEVMKHER